MGNMFLAVADATTKGGLGRTSILIIVVLFGAVHPCCSSGRSDNGRQRQGAANPGRGHARTPAGHDYPRVYGTVTSVDGQDLELEIAPGVEIRIMRRAVMNILPEDSPEDDAPAEPETGFGEKPADDWDSTDKNP